MLGLSVLGRLNFPFGLFGTVQVLYGLWALLRATERLFTTTTPTAAP